MEGSNLGSPCPGRSGSADLGHTALDVGCLQPSTHCDHTGTAATGARAAPTGKSITPLINSIFLQLKWEKNGSCAAVQPCSGFRNTSWMLGPEGNAAAQPHSRAHSLGQDTALQAMSNTEGAQYLWGIGFFSSSYKIK